MLDALRDAVRAHLVSDVPLGAFLSGGIDSSVIVALMAEATSGPVKTFSIGFDDPEHDELGKARLVAERYGTDHHEFVVRPDAVEDVLPTLVSHFGEPFADSSALPTYYVSKLASESVKVALSGDGGDETFVGYTTFRGVDLARMLEPVPGLVRRSAAALAARPPRVTSGSSNDRLVRWFKRAEDSLAGSAAAYRSKIALTSPATMTGFLADDLRSDVAHRNPFRRVEREPGDVERHGRWARALPAGQSGRLAAVGHARESGSDEHGSFARGSRTDARPRPGRDRPRTSRPHAISALAPQRPAARLRAAPSSRGSGEPAEARVHHSGEQMVPW